MKFLRKFFNFSKMAEWSMRKRIVKFIVLIALYFIMGYTCIFTRTITENWDAIPIGSTSTDIFFHDTFVLVVGLVYRFTLLFTLFFFIAIIVYIVYAIRTFIKTRRKKNGGDKHG